MSKEAKTSETISPLAGLPAPKAMLVDLARLERDTISGGRTSRIQTNWSASEPAATGARRCVGRSPSRTSWPSRRPSASTAAGRAPAVRSTWVRTRTHCRVRLSALLSRCWRPTVWRRSFRRERRRYAHACRVARHPDLQPRQERGACRRHCHHTITQSAGGWRIQVQPAEWRSGRHGRNAMGRGPGQRDTARRSRSGQTSAA